MRSVWLSAITVLGNFVSTPASEPFAVITMSGFNVSKASARSCDVKRGLIPAVMDPIFASAK